MWCLSNLFFQPGVPLIFFSRSSTENRETIPFIRPRLYVGAPPAVGPSSENRDTLPSFPLNIGLIYP